MTSQPHPRPFAQVDVFSREPFLGNPVAVVLDGTGLRDQDMARFARWTNLSETTFVLPPTHAQADYRLRIFTPERELPFAGHPTLGSAHAWLQAGNSPRLPGVIVQECTAGLVDIHRSAHGALAFTAPPTQRSGELSEAELTRAMAGLGLERERIVAHQWVDNGPGWATVLLRSAEEVLAIEPNYSELGDLKIGVVGPHPGSHEQRFEVRAFVTGSGGTSGYEDPVTGSLNASVAQWLIRTGRAPAQYTARQGTVLGRRGIIAVTSDHDGTVRVGGHCTVCVQGTVLI